MNLTSSHYNVLDIPWCVEITDILWLGPKLDLHFNYVLTLLTKQVLI